MADETLMPTTPTTHEEWRAWAAERMVAVSAQLAQAAAQCAREGHIWRWVQSDGERCGSAMAGWWYLCERCREVGQAHELPGREG